MITCTAVKAQIVIVLGCMSEDINWKDVYENLKVYQNPWAVVAKKDFDQNELVLVPATQNVKARLPTDKLPDKAIDLGALMDTMHFHLMPQLTMGKAQGQNFVAPFWCVPQAAEDVNPNMSHSLQQHKINVVFKTGDTPENLYVTLPTLTNHRKIKAGECLVQGTPRRALRRAASDAASASGSKRQKT